MSGKRGLSDDEIEVWATVTRSIRPLRKPRRVEKTEVPMASPRKTAPKIAAVKPQAVPLKRSPEPAAIAPLTRREKQRVARGHDRIDARLDLHGHTLPEAHAQLLRFLRRASENEARLVLVITGKSGVLRQEVPRWLSLPDFRVLVIAAEPAAIRHGGDGALYLRVRRERR